MTLRAISCWAMGQRYVPRRVVLSVAYLYFTRTTFRPRTTLVANTLILYRRVTLALAQVKPVLRVPDLTLLPPLVFRARPICMLVGM